MNILNNLSSLLTSLRSTLTNLLASLSGSKTTPSTTTTTISKSTTPPAAPMPTPPTTNIQTTPQKISQTVNPPVLMGAPQPLPGGGVKYITSKGEVEIPKNVKITNIPASYMPGSGLVSVYDIPNLAADKKYRESVLTTYSPYQPTTQPTTQLSTYQPATQPETQPITTTYQPTTQPTLGTTTTANLGLNTQQLGVNYAIPSIGYSSSPSKYGITGAITPLSSAGQSLLSLPYVLPEEEKKTYKIKEGDTLSKIAKEQGVSLNDLLKSNPQITNPNLIRAGEVLNLPSVGGVQGVSQGISQPISQPTTQPITQPTQIQPTQTQPVQPSISLPQAVSPEGIVDLEAVQEGINKVKDLMKSPLSKQTIQDFNSYLENTKQTLVQAFQQLNPLPETPIPKPETIAENADELQKLQNVNPVDYDSIMSKYGIPDLIKQMEDMQNQILAETQLGNQMIQQIQNDPDFPKALAERRIAQLQKANQTNLEALKTKYNFLMDLYNVKIGLAKQEIAQKESAYSQQQNEQERQRDNARQMIQQMISTGAIANLSDNELQQWANVSGYTLDSLKSIRTAVKTGNDLKIQQAQAKLEKTAQATTAPTSITGANYNTRLNQEIANLYAGRYGTIGAREKVIQILKNEFPSVDVARDIYNRVPDNWEETAKKASPIIFEDL